MRQYVLDGLLEYPLDEDERSAMKQMAATLALQAEAEHAAMLAEDGSP